MKSRTSFIGSIVTIILLIITIIFIYQSYKTNNFNDFQRSERQYGKSEFKRDKETKYSEHDSYEIIQNEFNDAMFYKTIKTKENTPYKVTCMVKTENVEPQEENKAIGAQIATNNTTERSVAISRHNRLAKNRIHIQF